MECPWGSGAQTSKGPHAPEHCRPLPRILGSLAPGIWVDQVGLPLGLLLVAPPLWSPEGWA